MPPTFKFAISVPSAVSSLAFIPEGSLCAGSDDGTVRFYDLPSKKVSRAIKSLGSDVSSITVRRGKEGTTELWIASGPRAMSFSCDNAKMILTEADALSIVNLGADEEEAVNELAVSENGKYLAFGTDAGSVGIVDLTTKNVSTMKTDHSNICGSVKFIPDRPSELVSGGYDSALLHFDFNQGVVLSRFDVASPPPSAGVSLSLPFILSISVAATGLFAAATADGRVWLGGGGEKCASPSGTKKKRSRRWEGLTEHEGIWLQITEDPVVSVRFSQPTSLFACTLLGTISMYKTARHDKDQLTAEMLWSSAPNGIAKVNTIASNERWLTVGGLVDDGRGTIEVWDMEEQCN